MVLPKIRRLLPILLASAAPVVAQPNPASGDADRIELPRDRARVVARVDGRDLTMADVVEHIDSRHAPGFGNYLETDAGVLYFRAPYRFGADWVRQYADIAALQAEAKRRGLEIAAAEEHLSAALKSAFELHLESERKNGRLRGELTQEEINTRLTRYQQEYGMQTEVQGWLDFLVPDDFTMAQLREFYTAEARMFGGRVTFSHILIQNRDPFSLHLLGGDARKGALERVADLRDRLKDDGSNFEDVAGRYSEDRTTAARGGVFRDVARFDPRLPAALCRAAWKLADGQFTGPVESPFGLHFVKRISFVQASFIAAVTDQTAPRIREGMRKSLQEDLLFAARERFKVELFY